MSSHRSDSPIEALDDEIEQLKAQIASHKHALQIHASALLIAPSTQTLLQTRARSRKVPATLLKRLDDRASRQAAHAQRCAHRLSSGSGGVTSFRVQDPDPNAVDGGKVLGLRFEVLSKGRFLKPYFVMLNRPYGGGERSLRVHRHTVPPCIPLAGLAARFLPAPSATAKQDLGAFAKALRRAIVAYHNRIGVIADLKRELGLGQPEDDGAKSGGIVNISPADAEARQITLEWADGRTGRMVIDDTGKLKGLVVLTEGGRGRDREVARELVGDQTTVEGILMALRRMDK